MAYVRREIRFQGVAFGCSSSQLTTLIMSLSLAALTYDAMFSAVMSTSRCRVSSRRHPVWGESHTVNRNFEL
jgi:hypothetical protein